MKLSTTAKDIIHIAIVKIDPLQSIGFCALLESEPDFELIAEGFPEALMQQNTNLILLGSRSEENLAKRMSNLKAMRLDLPIIVIASKTDDEAIFSAITAGARGYVLDGARPCEFAQAIRTVNQGSIWAPRRVLSMFIERASTQLWRTMHQGHQPLTPREKDVLKMLVAGLSNKEIGAPLGIEERTVKAHMATMMREVGVPNRIALSVHAITNSLVSRQPSH